MSDKDQVVSSSVPAVVLDALAIGDQVQFTKAFIGMIPVGVQMSLCDTSQGKPLGERRATVAGLGDWMQGQGEGERLMWVKWDDEPRLSLVLACNVERVGV